MHKRREEHSQDSDVHSRKRGAGSASVMTKRSRRREETERKETKERDERVSSEEVVTATVGEVVVLGATVHVAVVLQAEACALE